MPLHGIHTNAGHTRHDAQHTPLPRMHTTARHEGLNTCTQPCNTHTTALRAHHHTPRTQHYTTYRDHLLQGRELSIDFSSGIDALTGVPCLFSSPSQSPLRDQIPLASGFSADCNEKHSTAWHAHPNTVQHALQCTAWHTSTELHHCTAPCCSTLTTTRFTHQSMTCILQGDAHTIALHSTGHVHRSADAPTP